MHSWQCHNSWTNMTLLQNASTFGSIWLIWIWYINLYRYCRAFPKYCKLEQQNYSRIWIIHGNKQIISMKLLKKFLKTSARCFHTYCIFVSIQPHHWWPWNAESSWKVLRFSLVIILHVRTFIRLIQTVVLPMYILLKDDWIMINFFSRFFSLWLGFLPVKSANIWINLRQFYK